MRRHSVAHAPKHHIPKPAAPVVAHKAAAHKTAHHAAGSVHHTAAPRKGHK